MKHSIILAAALIAGLTFPSCKKNDSNSTTPGQSQMTYQLKATNTSYAMKPAGEAKTTASTAITWTAGYANPSWVKFEAKKGNTSIELTSTNKAQIDLMSSVGVDFGGFTLPSGTYNEIQLKIHLERMGAVPSMEVDGQLNTGLTTLPVSIVINEPLEIQTDQGNVTIADNNDFTAVTTLDLAAATNGITADMLLNANLTNGSIVISSGSNIILYHMILSNLNAKHAHCEFFHHQH